MGQTFHKFKAETFDEAYRQMVRKLGDDAVVVNTTEVTGGGLFGLLGHKVIELTASPPAHTGTSPARKRSLAEKKYAAYGAAVGSDETVNETVAYFKQIVNETQARKARTTPGISKSSRSGSPSILPFRRKAQGASPVEELRREVQEMRQLLQVLIAETPRPELPAEFAPHYRALVDRGVTRTLAAALVSAVVKGSDPNVIRNPRVFTERLRMEIQKRVSVTHGIRLSHGTRRNVALVGATGVGKTTNLAKLAARFAIRERARVGLITMDTYRIAAPEQLRVYADIIGLPMRITNDPTELVQALQVFRDYDLVFMDTVGGSQFNQEQLQELKNALDVARPDEVLLVLSANTQVEELTSVVQRFGCLNPTSLLFSKLDETRRYGALFTLATETGLPLSYFSTGQNVPDEIELATPSKTAKLLLDDGGNRGGSSTQSSGVR